MKRNMDDKPLPPAPRCPNCDRLERRVRELEAEIERLRGLVEELQRGVKRQSSPFSKGPPKPDPKKPGRKEGDAYGTKAHRPPPTEVDETYDAPAPCSCPGCGGSIELLTVVSQFQVEVPRRPIRRRFDVGIGRCRNCGRRVQGRHPLQTSDALGAAASQLGPEAQALMVHMNKDLGVSHGKITRFFQSAFGISVSRGGSVQVILRAGERCGPAYREIELAVRRSAEVVPDETGWRVGGVGRWLWAFVTRMAVLYTIRNSRGYDVPEEVLGADYAGRMTHDGWSVYDRFFFAFHQQCLGHLLRRCVHLLETARRGAVRFPRAVKALLRAALKLRDRREARGISWRGFAVARGRLAARLDRLLEWHRTNAANERFAAHLDKHRDQILNFLQVRGMPATNWAAEQAIRPAVVNRKVWGGNRTENGAVAQSRLMSVLRTCVQLGRDGIRFLCSTLRAPPSRPPRLLLNAARV